jgi:hypothetical protein
VRKGRICDPRTAAMHGVGVVVRQIESASFDYSIGGGRPKVKLSPNLLSERICSCGDRTRGPGAILRLRVW